VGEGTMAVSAPGLLHAEVKAGGLFDSCFSLLARVRGWGWGAPPSQRDKHAALLGVPAFHVTTITVGICSRSYG
jgi:hypothetical protein